MTQHYFTQHEAEKLKATFSSAIGQEFYYSTEMGRSKLRDVIIQKTRDILVYGEILQGYLVIFHFETGSGLTPFEFTSLNGFTPIIAKWREITESEVNKILTNKFMYGIWESKEFDTKIEITKEAIRIEKLRGKLINHSFHNSGAWVWDWYTLLDPHYVILSANEANLTFGQLVNPVVLNAGYNWVYKFERVG